MHPKEQFASAKWKEWFLSSECEQKFPPNNLSPFQQCLLVNSCRPDRLINSLSEFVTTTLKLQNLSGAIGMEQLCNRKMTKDVPCLFIVSVGFDPSK